MGRARSKGGTGFLCREGSGVHKLWVSGLSKKNPNCASNVSTRVRITNKASEQDLSLFFGE